MGRSKLDKFRDNAGSYNVLEPGKPLFEVIRGNWSREFFRNTNPVEVELACGRGDYTVGLARLFPGKNFIGVDIKGSRIWTGSRLASEGGLTNVAFLRIQIQGIGNFFGENEIDAIWIPFPDPRPRERDIRRRLTAPRFLAIYHKILKPGGWVYLKTDNENFFSYSLECIRSVNGVSNLEWTDDLYRSRLVDDHHGLTTNYERRFLEQGIKIKYLKFQMM